MSTATPYAPIVDSILDVRELTVSFDGFKALDGLDFFMQRGELRFVIGPNGAGKTTLLDVITGKTHPDQGAAWFDGSLNVLRLPEHVLVRNGIARKFQTPSIFRSLSVYQNLEVSAGFADGLARLLRNQSERLRRRIEPVLALIGLQNRRNTPAGTLAHGEKQWLEIGMLLVQEPKLLLLDEPVAGMTRPERMRTGELLLQITKQCSVLVVEHDMEFLRNFASTVSVLHMGRLLCQGPVQQVQSDPRVVEVYLGRGHSHVPGATVTQTPEN
jgi:urea transport system ATP-binding protein